MPRFHSWLLLSLLFLPLAGCGNNVGRIFDPDVGSGGNVPGTGVQPIPVGGNAADGRPRVRSVYPEGGGWPASVPIVVTFSESVNRESVAPSGPSASPTLFVRAVDSEESLAATYDFLLGDTVVVIRPQSPLTSTTGSPDFEVVIAPQLTDADGITHGGRERVLATFTTDESTGGSSLGSIDDGRILVTLPEDNAADVPRESPVYLVFTKAPDATTVDENSVQIRSGGLPLTGDLVFPLRIGTAPDHRVLCFTANDDLPAAATIDIVVDDTITFGMGMGQLEFNNRTPFASFDTLAFAAPLDLAVGNFTAGFPDKVNLGNLTNLMVDVSLDTDAAIGDRVVVRLYGLEPSTETAGDVDFVERSFDLVAAGMQTVSVDFSSALGTVTDPRFEDGALTLIAQLRRGSLRTGFIEPATDNEPRIDTVRPDLVSAGPPSATATDHPTDLERVAFFGVADEEVAAANVSTALGNVAMFAARTSGEFVCEPLDLGLAIGAVDYSLDLTDTAGNDSLPIAGRILPRGVIAGSVGGGTLVVEVYDETDLAVVAGATVIVQPDPTSSVGRVVGTTNANGRVTFSGLSDPRHTITVVASGHHLTTLHDTGAGYASLAIEPQSASTAQFTGGLGFVAAPGQRALVGINLLDDPTVEGILTTTTAPVSIPTRSIRPNRLAFTSGFGGTFEPMAAPAFAFAGCQLCGANGLTATAPLAPPAVGETSSAVVTLQMASQTSFPTAQYSVDFAAANGLGTVTGTPTVRLVANLLGFPGMSLVGAGFASNTMGETFSVDATLWNPPSVTLLPFTPVTYASIQATDAAGNISRHRAIVDPLNGGTTPLLGPPGVPTIATPGGPFTGAVTVTYDDWLDASMLPGGIGLLELTAVDGFGREWRVWQQDLDGTLAGDMVVLPDLTGTGAVGLSTGTWMIRAESHLSLSLTLGADKLLFEEFGRQQAGYARAVPVSFTVN